MRFDAKRRAEGAARRAAILVERQQDSERRVAEEENMLAETARLRNLRALRRLSECIGHDDLICVRPFLRHCPSRGCAV